MSDQMNYKDKRECWQSLEETVSGCCKCERLVTWREATAQQRRRAYMDWVYWGKPVPGFGDHAARILVVGLAPGAHGSNRTGRMFTGDASGGFLYPALHRAGFANQPQATQREDGLVLTDVFISSACRCAPPDNKPTTIEINTCLPYLEQEIALLPPLQVVVALGRIAFDALLSLYRLQGHKLPRLAFEHGKVHNLGNGLPFLITSYHPSRQNTQTGRLTVAMFDQVWQEAKRLLS